MKITNWLFVAAISILALLIFTVFSFAQGMMGINFIASKNISVVDSNGHTAREEAEGEEVWNSLQNQEV